MPNPRELREKKARHFSCGLTAAVIARISAAGGDEAVRRALESAASRRDAAYLTDIGNWVSYEEMVALWEAGAEITGDIDFARHAGEDAVHHLGSSELEALEVRPGFAEIRAATRPGFSRHPLHCEWTRGMLSQATALFGLLPATVEHSSCQGRGAADCRYLVRWDPEPKAGGESAAERALSLEHQLRAMSETLNSVFATATDLIDSGDLDVTLARITERAALQVHAPNYVLAVRPGSDSRIHRHQRGLDEERGREVAERVLAPDRGPLPSNWLAVPVRSQRNQYGWLVAIYEPGARFLPQERELLEVYARYAATVLDSASALSKARELQREAQRRYEESRALLNLARSLATAASSEAVARRLADAVPSVIDCDTVTVFIWDEREREFVRMAFRGSEPGSDDLTPRRLMPEEVPRLAALIERPNTEPLFADLESAPEDQAQMMRRSGMEAVVTVPIATDERLLGCLVVAVQNEPERLRKSQELRDRVSGVAAHAITALENGRLVDRITHQAHHDHLTDLLNRTGFREALAAANRRALESGEPLGLFFLDLDGFKEVNDEFGHEAGDDLLGAIADRLAGRLRLSDTAARLGGDEFAVIVEQLGDDETMEAIGERLAEAFLVPFGIGEKSVRVEASIGHAIWPLDVQNPEELLRRADAAMYEVKRRGRPAIPGP